MSDASPQLKFEVLIDAAFSTFNDDTTIRPSNNKKVLSLINDFEDTVWRYAAFQHFIWDNIAETSLSADERQSLVGHPHSLLAHAAKSLRLVDALGDLGKGSEIAEIVLYGIMKAHYNALPVVPKIFYKQNPQDNAKGADSVHIVISTSDFTLWLGEAKFYNDIEDARLGSIVDSVGNALQTIKIKKENSIITNVRDLDSLVMDDVLRSKIKDSLKQEKSIDEIKPRLHIPILVLHECAITKSCVELTPTYRSKIVAHHKDRAKSYFKKQVHSLASIVAKYSEITFHIILFPVPDKKAIVDKFLLNVAHHKAQ